MAIAGYAGRGRDFRCRSNRHVSTINHNYGVRASVSCRWPSVRRCSPVTALIRIEYFWYDACLQKLLLISAPDRKDNG